MNSIILDRLNEMASTLREIKLENANLRKAIFGIESCASSSSNSQSRGLLGNASLAEVVVGIQNQVKALNRKIFNDEENYEETNLPNSQRGEKRPACDSNSGDSDDWDKPPKKRAYLAVPSKQLQDERKRMNEDFNEFIKTKTTDEGKSLVGKTVEWISASMPFPEDVKTSITLKLSNHLDSDLTDPQNYSGDWSTPSNGGPTKVRGNFTEVFTFLGKGDHCEILCSFAVRTNLRLAIYSYNYDDGSLYRLVIGFIPKDAVTDQTLISTMEAMPPNPEVRLRINFKEEPIEVFIRSGNLIARGELTAGPRSILNVQILENNSSKA